MRRFSDTPSVCFAYSAVLVLVSGSFRIPASVSRRKLDTSGSSIVGVDGGVLVKTDAWASFWLNWQANFLGIAALTLAGWGLFLLMRRVVAL